MAENSMYDLPKISIFDGCTAQQPAGEYSLTGIVYFLIVQGASVGIVKNLPQRIADLRKHLANGETDQYREKKKQLPAVTFAGTFSARNKASCTDSTGFITIDIDNLQPSEVESVREKFKTDKHVLLAFISPSGRGLKVLYRMENPTTSPERYRAAFNFVLDHVRTQHGIEPDTSGADISRLCFLSYDASFYWNYDSIPFTDSEIDLHTAKTTEKSLIAAPNPANHTDTQPGTFSPFIGHSKGGKNYDSWLKMRAEQITLNACNTLAVQKGHRHDARLRAGYLVGGFLAAGGTLDNSQWARIEQAVYQHTDKPEQADKEFTESIESGKQKAMDLNGEYQRYLNHVAPSTDLSPYGTIPSTDIEQGIPIENGEVLEQGFILDCLEENQRGDAKLLRRIIAGAWKFDQTRQQWRAFRGGIWVMDSPGMITGSYEHLRGVYFDLFCKLDGERAVRERAELMPGKFADSMRKFTGSEKSNNADVRVLADLKKRIKKLGQEDYRRGVLRECSNEKDICCHETQFDRENHLIPFNNGVYDAEKGEFREYTSADLFTRKLTVDYIPNAGQPVEWVKFLQRIFDGNNNLIRFIRQWVGLCLTGYTVQNIFFAYGTGANGKTVFFRALQAMLESTGDDSGFYQSVRPDVLLESKHGMSDVQYSLAALRGARLAVAPELPDKRAFNAAILKTLTGGDSMEARRIRESPFSFKPVAKFAMCGNHQPHADAGDDGFFRRFWLVPFAVTIPEQDRVPLDDMLGAFRAELPSIINWAITGLNEFVSNGKKIIEPNEVREATERYRLSVDSLGAWLDDVRCEGGSVPLSEALQKYKEWCATNGERPACNSGQAFAHRLEQKKVIMTGEKGRKRYVQGISV